MYRDLYIDYRQESPCLKIMRFFCFLSDDIVKTTGNNSVEIRHLDLSSLSSVRTFAKTIIESESRLDVLINNAGLGGVKKTKTEDNLEMTMQVNHFGHFLLTCLLLGK